jgi:hypothetical protein
MSESTETTTTTTEYDPSAPVPPGAHVFRIWLSPSGETTDVRADRAEIGKVTETGALLALFIDGAGTVIDGAVSRPAQYRVFTAVPGSYSRFARVDAVVTGPTPVRSSTLEGNEVEGER